MNELVIALGIGGAMALAWWLTVTRRQRNAWRIAGAELELAYRPTWFRRAPGRLDGNLGGIAVTCETRGGETRAVAAVTGFAASITLGARAKIGTLDKLLGEAQVEVGDPRFAELVVVHGLRVAALAALDETTRKRVALFVARGGHVDRGAVVLEDQRILEGEELNALVQNVASLARLLSSGDDVTPALAANVRCDGVAGVRLANLVALHEHHRDAAQETLRFALQDRDARVRLEAARRLHEPAAAAVLRELIASATDDALFVEAVREALAYGQPDGAEPRLIALLQAAALRRDAAQLLGELGTIAAVEPLLAAGERDAARRIQARLGDAEAGRVSLAETQGGELSVAAPRGAVSLEEEE